VRYPTNEPPEALKRVGQTTTLSQDLIVVNLFEGKLAVEPDEEVGSGQHVIARLPRGTNVKICGLVTRRFPDGKHFYYACRVLDSILDFDVDVDFPEPLGFPKGEPAWKSELF
jgi:hypothetical protein